MKQTLKEAGYQYISFNAKEGIHLLKDLSTGNIEIFVAHKNHASWGIIYKNTHLEFCATAK